MHKPERNTRKVLIVWALGAAGLLTALYFSMTEPRETPCVIMKRNYLNAVRGVVVRTDSLGGWEVHVREGRHVTRFISPPEDFVNKATHGDSVYKDVNSCRGLVVRGELVIPVTLLDSNASCLKDVLKQADQ